MNYEHIINYVMTSPMGLVVRFEAIIRSIADSKGISYEEEVKNFESFKDSMKNIHDIEFVMKTDEYEEVK